MKTPKWMAMGVALAMAVVMVWAAPSLAQGRGKGQRGQAGQGRVCGQGPGQGQGAGYGSCPYYSGDQNSRGYRSNNSQANSGRQGRRGGGRFYQSNVPPATQ